ncbi:uncharacterized protein [Epargyreus clarus]|uniref:uncharacterized protein n=1 Tax=Epargyreus clarus TaxID=520877 RepID=UPI003C301F83
METFRFASMKNCAEMVSKALPDKYEIKNIHEYVCYTSDDHYVTDEDAGAPAIRHGHLIAMTVGGVECDGERVAVGIKMSCFCSWISENLPDDTMNMKCCDHCCDEVKPAPTTEDYRNEEATSRKRKKSKF